MPGFARRATGFPGRRAAASRRRLAGFFLRFDEASQLRIFEANRARGHFRDDCAAISIHETATENEVLEPAPRSGEPQRAFPVALPLLKQLLSSECAVALDIGFMFIEGAHSVMKQVSTEPAELSRES